MKKIFIIAGEMSGDGHGAGLIKAIQEKQADAKFLGLGGPRMRKAGGEAIDDWVEDAGVVGLWEVLKKYGWFRKRFNAALANIRAEKPDAVILIDYPGFNLRMATALKKAALGIKIIYYISPQVWAWKQGRIKTMARDLDLMICIFPFEKELYEQSGLRTVFAGHPMVDRIQTLKRGRLRETGLVGFFPGSRSNEVQRIFPVMLEASKLIRQAVPEVRFAASAANQRLAHEMRIIISQSDQPAANQWIEVGNSNDLMQRAQVGVVASGTATMEAACFDLPYILVYQVTRLTYLAGKMVMKVKHLGIVNILAGKEVVQELLQDQMTPERVSEEMIALLKNDEKRDTLLQQLREVVAQLGAGDAYQRAASAVLEELNP